MILFLAGIRQTLRPRPDAPHGPLPPLLLAMTVVTGLVDAYSYLDLGHVFVANMTGNVVFLAFAVMGAPGFSIPASLAALAAFGAGAALGGRIAARVERHRARLLGRGTVVQALFMAASVVLSAVHGGAPTAATRYGLIAVLSIAMGIQNAAARALAVPDMTTTVLTLTITGLAADTPGGGAGQSAAGRRTAAVLAMFAGAVAGAALVVHGQRTGPLLAALVVTAAVGAATRMLGAGDPAWAVVER